MAERCLELLALSNPEVPRLLLDLGCGSGISGSVLSDSTHQWIGCDISESMLRVAREELDSRATMSMDEEGSDEEEESYGPDGLNDLLLHDMGQGVCFRPGTFDGCIR